MLCLNFHVTCLLVFRLASMILSMEYSTLGFSLYSTWSWRSASPLHSLCHLVCTPCLLQCVSTYRVAGNFRGRKLSRIGGEQEVREENFCGLLGTTNWVWVWLSIFAEKTFVDRHKTMKFVKVFSLESFPLCGIHACTCTQHMKYNSCTHNDYIHYGFGTKQEGIFKWVV